MYFIITMEKKSWDQNVEYKFINVCGSYWIYENTTIL